jgi:hypothetical protein
LLDDMGQFVGEEALAARPVRLVLARREGDPVANREGMGPSRRVRSLAGLSVWTRTWLKSWPKRGSKNA